MTHRDNQLRLDGLAMHYLWAVEAGDLDAMDALWAQAATDPDLSNALTEIDAELAAEDDRSAAAAVVGLLAEHLPSAEVVRPAAGPVTVAEVADHLRRHPPRGLTADELAVNDRLRAAADPLPDDLGLPGVVSWGRRYGPAPEAYWKAFRDAAVLLTLRRESADSYQMAARPARPRPKGDRP